MKVRYTFRIAPTDRQKRSLAKTFGCVRVVYNDALRFRTDSYKDGVPVNYNASSANLTASKKTPERAFLNEVSSVPLQQSLRHLQTAYSNFFAKRAKFPNFKSKHGKQSAEFTTSAFKWDAVNRNLTISKVGRLRVKWSREFTSSPTTVTITKDCAGRYFVTLCLDEVKHALPKTGRSVGIDLGISRLATLVTKEDSTNPETSVNIAPCLTKMMKPAASINEAITRPTKRKTPSVKAATIKKTKSGLTRKIANTEPKTENGAGKMIGAGEKKIQTRSLPTNKPVELKEDSSSLCVVRGSGVRNSDTPPAVQALPKYKTPLMDTAITQPAGCQKPSVRNAYTSTTIIKQGPFAAGSVQSVILPSGTPMTPSKHSKDLSHTSREEAWLIGRVANPRHTAKNARKLAKLQRVLCRRKKGSNRYRLQKLKVSRLQGRIADTRKDVLDKLTTRLVREFDVLCIEDLNVQGMVKLPTLAKHISCASFGAFRTMLEYKALWYGKEVRVADRFFPSSKRCSACGHIHPAMPLSIREFNCVECGTRHDRDENAAKNILNFAKETSQTTAGTAGSHGRGQHVRPKQAPARRGNAGRSVNQPGSANV